MNIYVSRAVPIPEDGTPMPPDGIPLQLPLKVRGAALPTGFPFLVDGASGEVVEPVLVWMCSLHLSGARRSWVLNTALAHADALKDFWSYLAAAELSWNEVDEKDLTHYRDTMWGLVSRKTHKPLSDETVRLRLTHVLAFYDWARAEKHYSGAEFSKRKVRRRRLMDEDALVHIRSGSPIGEVPGLLPEIKSRPGDKVRPFGLADLKRVLRALGPLPSAREAQGKVVDPRPSRDRLAAEMGVVLGLRVDEVASLKVYQILGLCPASWEDNEHGSAVVLRLTRTKGFNPRSVILPTWLLFELDMYIRGERAEAAAKAAKLRDGSGKAASALFINGLRAGANVGKDITKDTLHEAFHRAALDAGLVQHVVKTDPDTGSQRLETEAKHSFHDLRHTFAVQTYWQEYRQGNREPWKIVQARLGHKELATTQKYYLRVVSADEAAVSDAMWALSRSIGAGEYV